MATGKVKWFNNAKGYGFIRPDAGGDDLFVHYSYITMDGYKSLKAGQPVEYEVQEAQKGLHAINLRILGDAPEDIEGESTEEAKKEEVETNADTQQNDSSFEPA